LKFAQVFSQRCFYLFVAVLALQLIASGMEATPRSRILFNGVHLLVLVTAVAAVSHASLSFVAGALLVTTMAACQVSAIAGDGARLAGVYPAASMRRRD